MNPEPEMPLKTELPLTFRFARAEDAKLYFDWANDPEVRKQSHNTEPISWEDHLKWFNKKWTSEEAFMLVFFHETNPVGQIRIEKGYISLSVAKEYRSKRVSVTMLKIVYKLFWRTRFKTIRAEVKVSNIKSIMAFEQYFRLESEKDINGVPCNVYVLGEVI